MGHGSSDTDYTNGEEANLLGMGLHHKYSYGNGEDMNTYNSHLIQANEMQSKEEKLMQQESKKQGEQMEKQQADLDSILGYKGLRAQQVESNKANSQWDNKDKKEEIKSAGQIDEKDDDDPDDLDDDLDDEL